MVRLGDICKFQSGGTPSKSNPDYFGGTIPWITTIALTGNIINETNAVQWITPKAIQETAAKIVPEYSIMVGTRVGVGKVAINSVPMSTSQDVVSLINIDSERWDKEYLCKLILSRNNYLLSQARGATIKGIKIDILAELIIPDVPLGEQRRIAATLDKVDNLISKRRQQLDKLDELVKARFVEMFGDPVNNPKHWNKIALGDRCKIVTGNTPSRTDPANYGSFIEWIKSDNINTPSMFLTEAQEYLSEVGFQKCRFVESGSLLMTCIAGSIGCIGNVAVTDRRVAFNQQINAVVPVQDNVLYLYWLMQLSKPIIHNTINMALKGILSKGQLSEMFFPFPPVELQDEFATFAEHTEKTKVTISQSLESLETLKKALMQEYFGTQI